MTKAEPNRMKQANTPVGTCSGSLPGFGNGFEAETRFPQQLTAIAGHPHSQ